AADGGAAQAVRRGKHAAADAAVGAGRAGRGVSPLSACGVPSPHAGGMSSTCRGGVGGGGNRNGRCSVIPPSPALPHEGGGGRRCRLCVRRSKRLSLTPTLSP